MNRMSISDYYILDKKIDKKNKAVSPFLDDARVIRIGLIGSFTLRGIKEMLNVKCDNAGLVLKNYTGEYNQYNQEILNKKSRLYQFKPHMTLLFLDIKDILGEHYHFPYRLTVKERRSIIKEKGEQLLGLAQTYTKNCAGKLLISNFSIPVHSPMGVIENRQDFGFFEMVRSLNRMLDDAFKNNPQVYIFDYDSFLSKHGKAEACDDKMSYLADIKLSQKLMPALCDEYMRYIKAIKGKQKKCIVLDLDNTLWGGIIGEEGFEGIKLGPTPPGNAFMEFQKYILSLFEKGIILAINSSNNQDEAMRVIKKYPYMILKEKHFASIKINWDNKANNLIAIAKELNIGLDSLIYIDDDKRNRELVKEMLPDVMVLDMPEDPALYLNTLKECKDLDSLQITDEDRNRGLMYAQERKRKEVKVVFKDMSDFIANLDIKVKIIKADSFSIPRLSQLTQRTNQFNLTTRRYSEEDIRHLMEKKGFEVYSIDVRDKFGDNGIAGSLIFKKTGNDLVFNNFLLSCRILGKDIERSIMAFCIDIAKKSGAKNLVCEYIPTEKNSVARKFLKDSQFELYRKEGKREFWNFNVKNKFKRPRSIKIITV